ncbi:hypothetical protein CCR75_007617 [Bremia lactucae]|uniref:Nep1-like protein n=1 Tax=Bremia lactucae TaxID=4779 RepID=A0A976ILM9_BRELC|nr:hypothetical protein CCR75_007617 [Bremia lactucae]
MKLKPFLVSTVLVGVFVDAQDNLQVELPTEPEKPPEEWKPHWIKHKDVKPFPELPPTTISEKAALMFKPQLKIITGCHPYPAVNEQGEVSGGLQAKGGQSSGCKGSGHGSQVYGRSTWYRGIWVIMYSWYFPKDQPAPFLGHRHDYEHVIIFLNNPAVQEPKVLGCSTSWHDGYDKYPEYIPKYFDGTSVKIKYEHTFVLNHAVHVTEETGSKQDLVLWENMPDIVRLALNNTKFGAANVPMNDHNFINKIEEAWPWEWPPKDSK